MGDDFSSRAPKTLIACGHLFSWSGGPVKTIRSFCSALDSKIYSFVEASLIQQEQLALSDAVAIRSVKFPILEKFYFPSNTAEYQKLNSVAKGVNLISCHSFYRYQIKWTLDLHNRHGVPYWHVPHGILDPYVIGHGTTVKRLFLSLVGRSFMDSASCTIFATHREQEKAESAFGPMRGEVVHWPVDLVDLSGREELRRETRQRLGIPEDATVLLYFGRVEAMKRPLETIEAVAGVKSDMLHLVMVGPLEGITKEELLNKAQAQGLHNFHYVGGVYGKMKYDYLLASDAYVSFSIRENFNHAAAESMSATLPVILSQGNDLGPIVEESGAGWYLKEDSVAALRSAIEGLMGTAEDELEKMGNSGRRLVADQFSFDYFRNRLLNLAKSHGRA